MLSGWSAEGNGGALAARCRPNDRARKGGDGWQRRAQKRSRGHGKAAHGRLLRTVHLPDSCGILVGAIGIEPTTPTMSRWCSNHLSYAPSSKSVRLDFKEVRIIRCGKIKSSVPMILHRSTDSTATTPGAPFIGRPASHSPSTSVFGGGVKRNSDGASCGLRSIRAKTSELV